MQTPELVNLQGIVCVRRGMVLRKQRTSAEKNFGSLGRSD